jgi:uncharacterized protein (UPF0332 family)
MNEIDALLKRAGDSLAAARNLVRDGFPDYAASRAYYSMFYVAEALLASLGQSYSSHSAVIAAFGREYAKTNQLDPKFHRWLISAQNFRNVGDYGVEAHVSKEQAELVCEWADQFIQAAKTYLSRKGGDPS